MSDNPDKLVIHTYTYSDKSYDIFIRLKNYMLNEVDADLQQVTNFTFTRFEIMPDGEVVLSIPIDGIIRHCNRGIKSKIGLKLINNSIPIYPESTTFYKKHKNTQLISKWLANQLKKTVHKIMYKNCMANVNNLEVFQQYIKWSKKPFLRDCNMVLAEFSGKYTDFDNKESDNLAGDITVSDVFCLYDILENTEKLTTFYTEEQLNNILGVQRDPVFTEYQILCQAETSKFKKDLKDNKLKILKKFDRTIKKIENNEDRKILGEKLSEDLKKLQLDYEQAIKNFIN